MTRRLNGIQKKVPCTHEKMNAKEQVSIYADGDLRSFRSPDHRSYDKKLGCEPLSYDSEEIFTKRGQKLTPDKYFVESRQGVSLTGMRTDCKSGFGRTQLTNFRGSDGVENSCRRRRAAPDLDEPSHMFNKALKTIPKRKCLDQTLPTDAFPKTSIKEDCVRACLFPTTTEMAQASDSYIPSAFFEARLDGCVRADPTSTDLPCSRFNQFAQSRNSSSFPTLRTGKGIGCHSPSHPTTEPLGGKSETPLKYSLLPVDEALRISRTPSSAPSPPSSYTGSVMSGAIPIKPAGLNPRSSPVARDQTMDCCGPAQTRSSRDNSTQVGARVGIRPDLPAPKSLTDYSGAYVPGVDLLVDGSEVAPIDMISRFSKTPVSSPRAESNRSGSGSFSQLPNQMDSNAAQRPASSAHTSSVSARSAGGEMSKAAKARYAQLRQQRKLIEPTERQPIPPLHLHLSKDGTSPLPPGWQRAPNSNRTSENKQKSEDTKELNSSDMYAYYYYHVRTRQTRWDPPVYPWDADPTDTLTGGGEDDPEAPYNWGCASKYAVTHEEIEAMYTRLRQRILERQCTDLLHELAGRPDAPQGAAEQGFAIELFTLVHNILRTFRDARCKIGRIVNDEDLYYLTKKLAQAVILKESQKLHTAQAASSSSLFSTAPAPELTASVQARVTAYVKKYMESKGAYYRRRVQQHPIPPISSQHPDRPRVKHNQVNNMDAVHISGRPMAPGRAPHGQGGQYHSWQHGVPPNSSLPVTFPNPTVQSRQAMNLVGSADRRS
ncbi:unnamed protein product [Calicophoron daubneyi]|uniref:WW domain-containing protein n=1 Tax=Calicophoron daubneyi TaxID=300641 RepID=A0AAV2TI04_CALDB